MPFIWSTPLLNHYLDFADIGHAPENITASTIQRFARNLRLVFDCLSMTKNSCAKVATSLRQTQ